MKKTINVEDCVNRVNQTMLGLSADISCHNCDKNYCCVGQKHVQIEQREFQNIEHLITAEQLARAREQIENPVMKRGITVYDCPFNDPVTGKCEIYDVRFMVCAGYGVVNPIEECDTDNEDASGTMVVNPLHIFEALKDEDTILYISDLARNDKETTVIDEFRRVLGI